MNKYILLIALVTFVLCDPNYRLNSKVIPSHYDITLRPYFDTKDENAFKFDGEVNISLTSTEDQLKTIKIHSEYLMIKDVQLKSKNGDFIPLANESITYEPKYTFAYINLEFDLKMNSEYYLYVKYMGNLRGDLYGFFKTFYHENGETMWMAATQMQAHHARKVFPCFDEPQYKATFDLIIDRPSDYKPTLTNMKIRKTTLLNNGYTREYFYTTPRMSTYLLAIIVSKFEAGQYRKDYYRELGIWGRPETRNQTKFAFEVAEASLEALEDYLGINYYLTSDHLKLDHAAIPELSPAAMENWGLVKYRELALMFDPEQSPPINKYTIARTIAHETSHMWFGNLVTLHWWNDTWLNEGFATFFQNFILSQIAPELAMGVLQTIHSAFLGDQHADVTPVSINNVYSPADIEERFGSTSYHKGGSVIRMIYHWIGNDAFRSGMNKYLTSRMFDVSYPSDVYNSLQAGVNEFGSISNYPGYTVGEVMKSWIIQAGYPLLHVTVSFKTNTINLTQRRFYTNQNKSSDEIYHIPITYTTSDRVDFENTKPLYIMSDRNMTIHDDTLAHGWVIFNIQETGFYRVHYDDHLWDHIIEGLLRNLTSIHPYNRAKLVNDAFAFVEAGLITCLKLYKILEFLSIENDYYVWTAAITGFKKLKVHLRNKEDRLTLEKYSLKLIENVIEELGYTERENDSYVEILNRQQLLEFACDFGQKKCLDYAVQLFTEFRDYGSKIPTSLHRLTYCYALKVTASEDDYLFLWKKMSETNVASEAAVMRMSLGCTPLKHSLARL